jgi:asparagine synthetase B (glutamine-hydrolysing)
MVSKLAAEHVKVVLTGDGGDEVFAVTIATSSRRERAFDQYPNRCVYWPLGCAALPDGAPANASCSISRSMVATVSRRLDAVPRRRAASAADRRRLSRSVAPQSLRRRLCLSRHGKDWLSSAHTSI